jgi:single-strand DNA-binding protein
MLNMQLILGRLGGDPEMRYTPQGTAVTTFSVAANHAYTKADGQKVKETEWFSVQTWTKLAEVCNQYLKKGSLVFVIGRTKTQNWNDEQGQKRTKKIVVADKVVFVDTRTEAAEQTDLGAAAGPSSEPAAPEEDIPF